MEDNEKNEVIDETIDEGQEEVTEVEETTDEPNSDDDSSGPTSEDYEALKKEAETLKAQKEHWRKKATSKPKEKEEIKETNKINTEQIRETDVIELARLASKGYSDEEISLLRDIKSLKGLNNLSDAINTPLFKANLKEKEDLDKRDKASLGASNKPLTYSGGKEPKKEDLKKAWLGK